MIDRNEVIKKWQPIIDNIVGDEKKEWMCSYLDAHESYESTGRFEAYQIVDTGKTYESDTPLLPICKQIAAQTIGLNLVAVKPMSAPKGYESEEDRIKRENYNERVVLHNKLNKIKDGEYNPVAKKEEPNSIPYIDFVYGSQSAPPVKVSNFRAKPLKRKKKNARN